MDGGVRGERQFTKKKGGTHLNKSSRLAWKEKEKKKKKNRKAKGCGGERVETTHGKSEP